MHDDTTTWEQELAAHDVGQLAAVQVDDCIGDLRYVACPRRGTHHVLTECWMCWCDWAWGRARLGDLLSPEALAAHPQSRMEALVRNLLGLDELLVEEDGAVPVRSGTAVYRVRLADRFGPEHVEVYALALRDVAPTPELLEDLNALNGRLAHCRAFWSDGCVVLAGTVVLDEAAARQLACLVDEVAARAHEEGLRLRERFGGQVALPASDADE